MNENEQSESNRSESNSWKGRRGRREERVNDPLQLSFFCIFMDI